MPNRVKIQNEKGKHKTSCGLFYGLLESSVGSVSRLSESRSFLGGAQTAINFLMHWLFNQYNLFLPALKGSYTEVLLKGRRTKKELRCLAEGIITFWKCLIGDRHRNIAESAERAASSAGRGKKAR